jgi:hypothetical protein
MARSRPFTSALVRSVAGILAAALLFELGLRPFVAGWNQSEGPVRTIRNYYEGFSVAHFEPDGLGTYGNRLTGNPRLADALEGLILGDSHVVAEAVRDQETMGAVVERLSRDSGHPLNVRQYGWTSANAPTYLASAEPLLHARNPAWVVVILNAANIGPYALTTTQNWRMEIASDGSFRLIDMRAPPAVSRMQDVRREIGRSALALALWRRMAVIRNAVINQENFATTPAPHDARLAQEAARVPRATVLGLKKAYGPRLIIVYIPYFPSARYDTAEPLEQETLSLCAEQGVACLSTRAAMTRERYLHGLLSRGFHNTAPGAGHFNATGHRIIGEEIWHYLAAQFPPPA